MYIEGNKFGFGAIICVKDFGETSYRYNSIFQERGKEAKYRYFRIIEEDTVRLNVGGDGNDSLKISSTIPSSYGSSELSTTFRYIQFYAGEYPQRTVGIH